MTTSPDTAEVVIVGGGAAGLATAIFIGQRAPGPGVVVLDGAARVGAKILVSGGGRCNVTNTTVGDRDFWTDGSRAAVRQILRAFPVADTRAWFADLGVTLHEEADGKLFPDANRARVVLDALVRRAAATGVEVREAARVHAVRPASHGFLVASSRGETHARTVVLATGGRSLPKSGSDGAGYELARSLGHAIVPACPALVPLLLDPERSPHRSLSGVSHRVELSVWIEGRLAHRIEGPLLWTHFGVSGPAALDASRHWERARVEGRSIRLVMNACTRESSDAVDRALLARAVERPLTSIASALTTWLPASVADAWSTAADVDPALPLARLTRDARHRLLQRLTAWELPVVGTRGFTHAEVTSGGVSLDEINPKTMESRVCPGLFLVGEVLDVDGRLGGFNFQWAWSSAYVAGRAVAARTRHE